MRRLLTAVLASGLAFGQPALAQVPAQVPPPQPSPPAQPTGRWSFGTDVLGGAGGVALGPAVGFRLKQWQRSALDAQAEAMWQANAWQPAVCRLTCPDRDPWVSRIAGLGLRWTTELSGPVYGVVTASLADVQWAKPTRERLQTGRVGMGNGVVLNDRGDALEFRVEAFNSPEGRDYAVAFGLRRTPLVNAAPRERRRLGALGERTVRTDLRRTRSRMDFESSGGFYGKIGGGRGIAPGVSLRQRVHRFWSVEGGAAYVEKGYGRDETLRMNYVELPVLANLELLPVHSRVQGFISAGLVPAVLESCTERNAALYGNQAQSCGSVRAGTTIPQEFRRFDLAREFRVGARVHVGAGRVVGMFTGSKSLVSVDGANSGASYHTVGSWGIGYERAF